MKLPWYDRAILSLFPKWGGRRIQEKAKAEIIARHYEAAKRTRRTENWTRSLGDANAVNGTAISELRTHARDLIRNNGWAQRAEDAIAAHTVGWGIAPKIAPAFAEKWKAWADTTACDADGLLTFAGLQDLVVRTVATAGECLVRRRWRRASDGLPIPLQLQVLEPDFLDTSKDNAGNQGNKIIQGVEFDKLGRRVGYWLFEDHPGSSVVGTSPVSRRVPASEIVHVFKVGRPGQVRGVSWFGTAIVPIKDLDEYEDAELVKQKIAACFAAFVKDVDGLASPLGDPHATEEEIETFEPGMIHYLQPGKDVVMASPPSVTNEAAPTRALRKIAAGLGIAYEELTGDYSNVNFSSARMGRLAMYGNVRRWQWKMLIPMFCGPVYAWAIEAARVAGVLPPDDTAGVTEWTPPPMPMIEPDKEGLAITRNIRAGIQTLQGAIREQGYDVETHLAEYAEGLALLDKLKIKLDSDVRAVSQAGLTQERVGGGQGGKPPGADKKESDT